MLSSLLHSGDVNCLAVDQIVRLLVDFLDAPVHFNLFDDNI